MGHKKGRLPEDYRSRCITFRNQIRHENAEWRKEHPKNRTSRNRQISLTRVGPAGCGSGGSPCFSPWRLCRNERFSWQTLATSCWSRELDIVEWRVKVSFRLLQFWGENFGVETHECAPTHDYAGAHIVTRTCTKLHARAQRYTEAHMVTRICTGLHTRARDYTSAHMATRTYTRLHARARDYTDAHMVTRICTGLHTRTRDYTNAHMVTRAYIRAHGITQRHTWLHAYAQVYTRAHGITRAHTWLHARTHASRHTRARTESLGQHAKLHTGIAARRGGESWRCRSWSFGRSTCSALCPLMKQTLDFRWNNSAINPPKHSPVRARRKPCPIVWGY